MTLIVSVFDNKALSPDLYCFRVLLSPLLSVSPVLQCYLQSNVISYHQPWPAMEFLSDAATSLIRSSLITLENGTPCDPLP